jgi:hypothetical protein
MFLALIYHSNLVLFVQFVKSPLAEALVLPPLFLLFNRVRARHSAAAGNHASVKELHPSFDWPDRRFAASPYLQLQQQTLIS